jgi:hypothetical protein
MEVQKNNVSDDREFIAGVWQKVRYLEYMKYEEKIVRKNNKNLFAVKFRTALCLLAAALIFLVPLVITIGINIFTTIVIGTILLSEGVIYEYIENVNMYRRAKHEN